MANSVGAAVGAVVGTDVGTAGSAIVNATVGATVGAVVGATMPHRINMLDGPLIVGQVLRIESLNIFEVRWDWKRPDLSKTIFDAIEGAIKRAMDPKEISESLYLTNTGRKADGREGDIRKAKEVLPEWYRSVDKVTKRNFTPHASYDKDKPKHLQLEWSQKLTSQDKFSMGNSGTASREACTWLVECPFGYTPMCKAAVKEGLERMSIQGGLTGFNIRDHTYGSKELEALRSSWNTGMPYEDGMVSQKRMMIKVISIPVMGHDSVNHPTGLCEFLESQMDTHMVGAIYTMEMRTVDASLSEPVYIFFALIDKPTPVKAMELKAMSTPGIRIREWGLKDGLTVEQTDLHLRHDRVALASMGVEAVSSKKTTQQMLDDKT
jgi:hypothetical protein